MLMTTHQKVTAALIVAAVIAFLLIGGLGLRSYERSKADKAVAAASVRALRATAVDSAKQAALDAHIAQLQADLKALRESQQQQQMQNLLLAKKNENLNKQLDIINGRLGTRPEF